MGRELESSLQLTGSPDQETGIVKKTELYREKGSGSPAPEGEGLRAWGGMKSAGRSPRS